MKILNSIIGFALICLASIWAGTFFFIAIAKGAMFEVFLMGKPIDTLLKEFREGIPHDYSFALFFLVFGSSWAFTRLSSKLVDDAYFKIFSALTILLYLFFNFSSYVLSTFFHAHFLSWVVYIGCLAIIGRLLWVQLQQRGLAEGLIMSSQKFVSKFTKSEA